MSPDVDPFTASYEIRQGSVWGSAAFVAQTKATSLHVPGSATGSVNYLIKAIDKSGLYSVNAVAVALTVVTPSAPTVTAQVIDNNVLLYWTVPASTQAIATYQVREGATFAGATIIGNKSGGFTSKLETTAGTYTYWVAAIDVGGNVGTPGSITLAVNQPPDFQLFTDYNSTFGGTLTSMVKDSIFRHAPFYF